jgi:hypothetical protein
VSRSFLTSLDERSLGSITPNTYYILRQAIPVRYRHHSLAAALLPDDHRLLIGETPLYYAVDSAHCLSSAPTFVAMQQQTPQAAWPHVLGIFSGHVFHFFTQVWPSLGGRAYLTPPKWVIDKLGGSAGTNIPGVDFRKTKAAERQQQAPENSQAGSSLNRSKRHRGMFATKAKGRKL